MKVSCIVNYNLSKSIGLKGSLLYKISEDLQFFKQQTIGKPIVMGRKTFNSLGNCPLPKRTNIILTKDVMFNSSEGEIKIYDDHLKILEDFSNEDEIVIIGGEQIYKLFEPYIEIVYACEVEDDLNGDSFFPIDLNRFSERQIIKSSYSVDYSVNYKFIKYVR